MAFKTGDKLPNIFEVIEEHKARITSQIDQYRGLGETSDPQEVGDFDINQLDDAVLSAQAALQGLVDLQHDLEGKVKSSWSQVQNDLVQFQDLRRQGQIKEQTDAINRLVAKHIEVKNLAKAFLNKPVDTLNGGENEFALSILEVLDRPRDGA